MSDTLASEMRRFVATLVALGRGATPKAALTAGARAAERVLTIRGGVVGPDFQAPFR